MDFTIKSLILRLVRAQFYVKLTTNCNIEVVVLIVMHTDARKTDLCVQTSKRLEIEYI